MDEIDEVKDEEMVGQIGSTISSSSSAIISIIVFSLYSTFNEWNTGTNIIILCIMLLLLFMWGQSKIQHMQFLQQDGGFGLLKILQQLVFFTILVIVFLLVRLVQPNPTTYMTQHPVEAAFSIFVIISIGAFIVLTVSNDVRVIAMKGERFIGFGVVVPPAKKKV